MLFAAQESSVWCAAGLGRGRSLGRRACTATRADGCPSSAARCWVVRSHRPNAARTSPWPAQSRPRR